MTVRLRTLLGTHPGTAALKDGSEVWAGALLQKPHHAAAAQRGVPSEGLLVGFYNFGSPASRYGLSHTLIARLCAQARNLL